MVSVVNDSIPANVQVNSMRSPSTSLIPTTMKRFSSPSLPKLTRTEITVLALLLVVLLCALNLPGGFQFAAPAALRGSTSVYRAATLHPGSTTTTTITITPPSPPPPTPDLRLLIGVFTMADKYDVRARHRLVNSFQSPTTADIDVKFVMCRLSREEQRVLVSLEILRHDDIIILDCKENMNDGKTYDFFKTVANIFSNDTDKYDYVMKADDDTYFRFPELVSSLRPLPRADLYYGFYVDPGYFRKGDPAFMAGMGYALSWDLVEWVATSEVARKNRVGHEDRVVGKWLVDGKRGRNVHDTKPSGAQLKEFESGGDRIVDNYSVQYDLPKPPYKFMPRTISLHRLKSNKQWARAVAHFNLTAGVKPSKFYKI